MASLPCATRHLSVSTVLSSLSRPYFPSGFFLSIQALEPLCVFISKLSVHSYGGTLCSWLIFFLLLCVILLPTSHHSCVATATLNNDTTFSLSPAFSSFNPLLFFWLIAFIISSPSLPSFDLCLFLPTTSSFVSVNYIERAVSWLWTGYDSLLSPTPPLFFLPSSSVFCMLGSLCFRDALGVGCIFTKDKGQRKE